MSKKNIISVIIKNPITYWMKAVLSKLYVSWKYSDVEIGYNVILKRVEFEGGNSVSNNTTLYNVSLGRKSYVSGSSALLNVTVGRYTSIAQRVVIGTGIHPTNFVSLHPSLYPETNIEEFKQTIIGNDVWIGANATILDGISIGDGAIVGAGAVVTKDIPPYEIWGGVPAKKIKSRYSDDDIRKLIDAKWWELSEDVLCKNVKAFKKIDEVIKLTI